MAIQYPVSFDSFTTKVDGTDYPQAIDINDVQDAIVALEEKIGIDNSSDSTSMDYLVNNFFVAGRKLWLYEDTAPTGWTIVSVTDAVLAVKGGTNAYNVTGGNTAGTWTQPTHTHAVGTFAVASHNHQWFHGVESPNNDQTYDVNGSLIDFGSTTKTSGIRLSTDTTSNCPGQRDYYTDNQSPALSGASASNGTPSTYRPYATVGIIIQKS